MSFVFGPIKQDFNEKYDQYCKLIYKIAFIHLGNKADSEEAVQEVFIKLFSKSPVFSDSEHEKAWLIRVTSNHCKNMLRSFWRKRVTQPEDMSVYFGSHKEFENAQLIINLPAKYKTIIHLFYYEGYAVKEISNIMKITESAVKMRLKRGREMLKMELEADFNE
ncbi:MAG: sigma-70 family polymerase sigma factor [Bacillales bacterium]|nr:sigma-70 family polymerase sigma factor [Bacillales bacterium]